jgi:protein SCO1
MKPSTVIAMMAAAYLLLISGGHAMAEELSPSQVDTARYTQRLGQALPLELMFWDETGRRASLAEFFGRRPAIVSLNYFHCQYVCPIEESGVISAVNGLSQSMGRDYTLATVSIDPRDGPADALQVKAKGLRGYDRPQDAAGWHVLTGDRDSIQRLIQALGFQDVYDAPNDAFAHPIGVVVITPGGLISQYVYGLDFSSTDLSHALIDAGAGHVGKLFDGAVVICYLYDPLTGQYTPLALNLMRGAAALGVLLTLMLLGWLWRDELRHHRVGSPGA